MSSIFNKMFWFIDLRGNREFYSNRSFVIFSARLQTMHSHFSPERRGRVQIEEAQLCCGNRPPNRTWNNTKVCLSLVPLCNGTSDCLTYPVCLGDPGSCHLNHMEGSTKKWTEGLRTGWDVASVHSPSQHLVTGTQYGGGSVT